MMTLQLCTDPSSFSPACSFRFDNPYSLRFGMGRGVFFQNDDVERRLASNKIEAKYCRESLRVMISGVPASGKGTQCELIRNKYGLAHIAPGDLLRAEVKAGSEIGRKAQDYMDLGQLAPDEVVVTIVKERLQQEDAQVNGWLLDGYPRSFSQASALEVLGIRPHIFLLLEVPDKEILERVIWRRIDPVTGKIYHLKFSPPESPEVAARLIQRSDDTEEKVKLRLKTHAENVQAVLTIYEDVIKKIDGSQPKETVFAIIEKYLDDLKKQITDTNLAKAGEFGHGKTP